MIVPAGNPDQVTIRWIPIKRFYCGHCCKTFGVNHYTDWKEILQKEKPDAVAIAVIPKHQYEIAKYALENGIAVFAEKPLTTSFDTSSELNELAKKKTCPT